MNLEWHREIGKYVVYLPAAIVAVLFIVGFFQRRREIRKHPMPPNVTDAEIAREARIDKIRAVRWYRTVHGAGFKHGFRAVERLMAESESKEK